MKYTILMLLSVAAWITGCKSAPSVKEEPVTTVAVDKAEIPAGTIVAADSMPVVEDQLNDFVFAVKVIATNTSYKGEYKVDATWGYNNASSGFTMPKGGEDLRPLMRRGPQQYSYIIGFMYEDDTTFYDYYLVTAERGSISMKYTKVYQIK